MKKLILSLMLIVLFSSLTFSAGNNWRNERPITGVAGTNYVVKSAIASSGAKAVIVYARGFTNLKYKTSTNGGVTWGAENPLPNGAALLWDSPVTSYRPIGVLLNGDVIEIVFAGSQNGQVGYVFYLRSNDFGGSWIENTQLASSIAYPNDGFTSVAITRCTDNVTQVAWTYWINVFPIIRTDVVHRRRTNTGWELPQTLASMSGAYSIHVDIAGRYNPEILAKRTFVIWNNPVDGYIYYKQSNDEGANWGATIRVEDIPNTGTGFFPAVKVKSNLNGFVTWQWWNGAIYKIRSKMIGGPQSVEVPSAYPDYQPRFTIDETDSLYLAYSALVSANYIVHGNKSLDGYTWSTEFQIEYERTWNTNLRCPDVSWTHTDGTMRLFVWNGYLASVNHQELWLGVNDIGHPAPPTNLQAVQYCNGPIMNYVELSWTHTTAFDDSGYKIYQGTWSGPWVCQNIQLLDFVNYPSNTYIHWTGDLCPCYCYHLTSVDLALNEGSQTQDVFVGACAGPGGVGMAKKEISQVLGESEPSQYTVRRSGRVVANNKTADIDASKLEYRVSGLDPNKYYALTLVYVFQGMLSETGVVTAWVDTFVFDDKRKVGKELSWVNHVLPKSSYKSGTLNFSVEKVGGVNSILSWFVLWSMPEGFKGGPQSSNLITRSRVQPYLSHPRPNPSTGEVYLSYWLPNSGNVSLRVYNTAGQLIREVESGERVSGTHSIVWDGKNADGMRVSNGVYLIRLVSGNTSATQKITIIK